MTRTPRPGTAAGWLSARVAAVGAVLALALAPACRASGAPIPGDTPAEDTDVLVESTCERWIAPDGDDAGSGTQAEPWATIGHAAKAVPDEGCTVWLEDGAYAGNNELERRFDTQTTFRAVNPYRAVLRGNGYVLDVGGSTHMVFQGLQFRHSGPGASGIVVYVGGSHTHHITFRDDVFHDSYDDDILKILDGARSVRVRDSVFYNQGPEEQHIDVNSVSNVSIEGNIFFNDFTASGRGDPGNTKAFIVVKDSNGRSDGVVGARGIRIERNVFLNWKGGLEPFLQVGNDGKPYFEARNVRISNNLLIGNSRDDVYAALGVSGAKDVGFVNNTIVGDLPGSAYAFHADIKDRNPRNEDIRFANNIWSDPTGSMDEFSNGDRRHSIRLELDRNLYWNGGARIPRGEVVSPTRDDDHRVVGDPLLNEDQRSVVLPIWDGSSFVSGNGSILEEFVRLVETYGAVPSDSPAVGAARRALAPERDILGHLRDDEPDLGAFEV